MKHLNFSARHVCKILLTILLCLVMVFACAIITGCSTDNTSENKPKNLPERFVEVDEELICPEYKLGVKTFYDDGSERSYYYYEHYLVDRVSRRVYIYFWDSGSHSSGMTMMECLDKDGNHMVYAGELPE